MLPKGTPLEDGVGADPSKFQKAVKVADKLGERIARTTDKIMEMRQDIDGKQVRSRPASGCWHYYILLSFKHDRPKSRPKTKYLYVSWPPPGEGMLRAGVIPPPPTLANSF